MSVSRRVLARYIAQQLAEGSDRTVLLNELAAYLVSRKKTGQLELVVSDIARNLAEMGTVHAKVSTARPLSVELKQTIAAYVSRIEDASHVEIQEQVEPEILGGIVIETPRKRFDASIATQLKRLSNV
jgi:F-type H+-transporting ATPase subunit delta